MLKRSSKIHFRQLLQKFPKQPYCSTTVIEDCSELIMSNNRDLVNCKSCLSKLKLPPKRKIIVFEGISGSGKSTLEDKYRKYNNYHDYTFHRFTASKYVYSMLYERDVSVEQLKKEETKLCREFDVRVVLCTVDPRIARARKIAMSDDNIEERMEKAQEYFIDYVQNISCLVKYIVVDTSESIESCFSKIIQTIAWKY